MTKNPITKYGLLGAIAVIAYFTIAYTAGPETFINPVVQWASMLLYGIIMYKAAEEDCAEHGTFRDFRAILRTPFIVFLLINFAYWLFFYALHLADPGLLELETAKQIEHIRTELTRGTGDPEQANLLREQLNYLEKSGMSLPVGPVFLRMAFGAIGGFGLAAGIAFFVKR